MVVVAFKVRRLVNVNLELPMAGNLVHLFQRLDLRFHHELIRPFWKFWLVDAGPLTKDSNPRSRFSAIHHFSLTRYRALLKTSVYPHGINYFIRVPAAEAGDALAGQSCQSTLMLPALTTFDHLAMSRAMKRENSSGVLCAVSMPSLAKRSCTSDCLRMRPIA